MAFPGTYNIAYYKSDTLEFKIYPKDSSGATFSLASYTVPTGEDDVGYFTISNYAGPAQEGKPKTTIYGYSTIVNNEYVLCAITPTAGNEMSAGTTYVYDVQISKADSPYNKVYTLLSGSISVTEEVTGA
jgi:hypothetical protein